MLNNTFYAPNFEKVGAYWFRHVCPCLRACVRECIRQFKKIQARDLKFHKWIPHQKIVYPYFFLV